MAITGAALGFLLGSMPSIFLLVSSFSHAHITVPKLLEAYVHNVSAGLILGAVAQDLFPFLTMNVPPASTFGGSVLGFVCGLACVFGMEPLLDCITGGAFDEEHEEKKIDVAVENPLAVDTSLPPKTRDYMPPLRAVPIPNEIRPLPPLPTGEPRRSVRYKETYQLPPPVNAMPRRSVIGRSLRRQIMTTAVAATPAKPITPVIAEAVTPEKQGPLPLPIGMIFAVLLDAFVDGSLIGVSSAINSKAGILLAIANSLQMPLLGISYGSRLSKCTESSISTRGLVTLAPPITMLLSAGLAAAIVTLSRSAPALFVAFVAFAIVALLALVCGELIVQGREAQGDREVWYVSLSIYQALLFAIILNSLLPTPTA